MYKEDGFHAGYRNFGRLALSFIPFALGVGLLVWLGFAIGVSNYKNQMDQERRSAIYVGAETLPKEKIKLKITKKDCTTIARADVKGNTLIMYAKNECQQDINYIAWHWRSISPDGTIIKSGYTNQCPVPISPHSISECIMKISTDERTETLELYTKRTTGK
jgi:hypothetical protein